MMITQSVKVTERRPQHTVLYFASTRARAQREGSVMCSSDRAQTMDHPARRFCMTRLVPYELRKHRDASDSLEVVGNNDFKRL